MMIALSAKMREDIHFACQAKPSQAKTGSFVFYLIDALNIVYVKGK
jgi:hypothetical protein